VRTGGNEGFVRRRCAGLENAAHEDLRAFRKPRPGRRTAKPSSLTGSCRSTRGGRKTRAAFIAPGRLEADDPVALGLKLAAGNLQNLVCRSPQGSYYTRQT